MNFAVVVRVYSALSEYDKSCITSVPALAIKCF